MKLNDFKIVRKKDRIWLVKDLKLYTNTYQSFLYFDYSIYIGEIHNYIRIFKLKTDRKQIERLLNLEIKSNLIIHSNEEYDIHDKPTIEEYLMISQFLKANKIMFVKKYKLYKLIS